MCMRLSIHNGTAIQIENVHHNSSREDDFYVTKITIKTVDERGNATEFKINVFGRDGMLPALDLGQKRECPTT